MPITKLKQILSGQFIRNVSWMGGAELINRLFRLATTVTLARTFSPEEYALMAIIYTTFEIANVFTVRGGIAAKIIQADEQDIKTICDTSYWLNWILCGSLFVIQCFAAFPIAYFYGKTQLILPLCAIAITYLIIPTSMVQLAMIQRENRLQVIALCNIVQAFVTNFTTVALAMFGLGIWAIVLPIILNSVVGIVIVSINYKWQPPRCFKLDRWQEITNFGKNMLGVELLGKLRGNIDYLVIGHFLGLDALGIYYFAFNAGLGISMNVINSFSSALFPYLCSVRESPKEFRKRYIKSLKMIAIIFVPLIIMQSSLAPFYVPLIFGNKWASAIPILIIICMSALPQAFSLASSMLLDAIDKTHVTLYLDMIFTIIFTVAIFISVKWGILSVAIAVLISKFLILPIIMLVTRKNLKTYSVKMQVF